MLDQLIVQRLHQAYLQLTADQIRDAIDYWRNNKEEIHREIEADEEALANVPAAW